jgi:hypothetical protein
MATIQQNVLDRIRMGSRGRVFTPKDFVDLSGRAAIDQALSRLSRGGHLQRLGRGLYYYPKINRRLGIPILPDLDELANTVGRQTGSRMIPSGAVAANRLGLSTQVPAKPMYLTDGRSRRVRVGSLELQMKHVPPKELPTGSRTSAIVFQALRHLGKDAVDDRVILAVRRALSPKQLRELAADAQYITDWITGIVRRITSKSKSGTEVARGRFRQATS